MRVIKDLAEWELSACGHADSHRGPGHPSRMSQRELQISCQKDTHWGSRHEAARSISSPWDHTSFTDQSQGTQFNLSTSWETRNNIVLEVWGMLQNAYCLGEEDSNSLCFLYKSRLEVSQQREGRKDEKECLQKLDPLASRCWLTDYLWGSHDVLMLCYLIHKCFVIKWQTGQGYISPHGQIFNLVLWGKSPHLSPSPDCSVPANDLNLTELIISLWTLGLHQDTLTALLHSSTAYNSAPTCLLSSDSQSGSEMCRRYTIVKYRGCRNCGLDDKNLAQGHMGLPAPKWVFLPLPTSQTPPPWSPQICQSRGFWPLEGSGRKLSPFFTEEKQRRKRIFGKKKNKKKKPFPNTLFTYTFFNFRDFTFNPGKLTQLLCTW